MEGHLAFTPVIVAEARRERSPATPLATLKRGLVLVPAAMALVVVCLVATSKRGSAKTGLLGWGELSAQQAETDDKMMQSLRNLQRSHSPAGKPSISRGSRSKAHFAVPRAHVIDLALPVTENLAYANHRGRFFGPAESTTFSFIKLDNVDITFLDKTNLKGYDGADMATLGKYEVMTRMGMIEHCNSANFNDVDGILGFGWADAPRSAALLKTLTQLDRPSWNLMNQPFQGDHKPMPRKFTFTANQDLGELQLGGYDPKLVSTDFTMFKMTGLNAYAMDIHSITYGGVELLHFADTNHEKTFAGEFDSGTTCLLIPSSVVKGNFTTAPFSVLRAQQMMGKHHPIVYKSRDIHGQEHSYEMPYSECVEPTEETMILGDPFFRRFVILHDLVDLDNKMMGIATKNPSYQLGVWTDTSILVPHNPRVHITGTGLTRMHAKRKMRDAGFVQVLAQTKHALHDAHKDALIGADCLWGECTLVDKVAVKSKTMVTYQVQLAIGTPPQPLDVIFDTGSYMLAVFANLPPAGMKPLLKQDKKKK